MKLKVKLLIPMVIILILAVGGVGLFAFFEVDDLVGNLVDLQLQDSINTVENTLDERLEIMNVTKQALNEKNIKLAQMVAKLIGAQPGILKTSNMLDLSKNLGVDEIHVTDENGVLTYGTNEEFFGFDYGTTEQTKPFLRAIVDKGFTLAQEPTPRGADQTLFQYIGVARIDKPGVVQVGIEPSTIEALMKKMEVQSLVERIHLGETGYVYIADEEGIIIAHPQQKQIGIELKSFDWGKKILEQNEGRIEYEHEMINKKSQFRKWKNYIIVSTIETSEIMEGFNKFKISIFAILIAAVLVSILAISILLKLQLIKPLKQLVYCMEEVGQGNLAIEINVESKDEIGMLARSFVKMNEQMRKIIQGIKETAVKSKDISSIIVRTSEEMGASSTEIAKTILEIASGATDQAIEGKKGFDISNDLAVNLEGIIDRLNIAHREAIGMGQKNEQAVCSFKELDISFSDNSRAADMVGKSIEELEEKSNKINMIVETIKSIADQTSLLALNAAIEAARAGENGRGFAVVADEIRKLADQSSRSTGEVQGMIQEIFEVMNRTSTTMEDAKTIVLRANHHLMETTNIYGEMKTSVDRVIDNIKALNTDIGFIEESKKNMIDTMVTISSVAQQAAASTEEISAVAEEQTASIEEVVASIQELDEIIKELSKSVDVFRL